MADTDTVDQDAAEEGGGKKKKKKRLLLVIVAAVVLLAAVGGGMTLLGGGGKKAAGAKAKQKKPELGEVVPIDAITLNLADGHYLKVGVGLQLSKQGSAEEIAKDLAPAQDATISLLGDMTEAQLSAHGGKEKAKALLNKRVGELYEGKVLFVYFTDFVIQ